MKKPLAALGLWVFIAFFLLFTLNIERVSAQNDDYVIQNVDHQIKMLQSGHIVVSDTITLTGQPPNNLLIGFPHKYGNQIIKGVAFDQNGILPMNLGVLFGNRSGFYGVEITLPGASPEVFTVVLILSNDLVTKAGKTYALDFPAYPSFTKVADRCNVTLDIPVDAVDVTITKPDGNANASSFVKDDLEAFTNSPAIATYANSLPDNRGFPRRRNQSFRHIPRNKQVSR